MAADNESIVRRLIEEGWNQRKTNVVDELMALNFVHHDPASPDTGTGPEGYKQLMNHYLSAFPDSKFTIEDVISHGDRTVTRWTVRATHKGELNGIRPTNKPVTVTGIEIARISSGKMVESWTQWDALGLMQQLGVAAAPAAKARTQAG